jgi:hypothetical protein
LGGNPDTDEKASFVAWNAEFAVVEAASPPGDAIGHWFGAK